MRDALLPLMKALVSDKLLKHSEEDVKITITSCITEITRISAPDAPYDDEKMKVTLKLLFLEKKNAVCILGWGFFLSYFIHFHWCR